MLSAIQVAHFKFDKLVVTELFGAPHFLEQLCG
jgi:hypothetical protein